MRPQRSPILEVAPGPVNSSNRAKQHAKYRVMLQPLMNSVCRSLDMRAWQIFTASYADDLCSSTPRRRRRARTAKSLGRSPICRRCLKRLSVRKAVRH